MWNAFDVANYCGWASVDTARTALARWRRDRGLRAIGRDSITGAWLYLAFDVHTARAAELAEAGIDPDAEAGTNSGELP
jgi:hypothetical protein